MTNKDFYERSKNFCGSIEEWFNNCVEETDLFRVWFKGCENAECEFYYFVNMIKVGDRYLLGLINFDDDGDKEKDICYRYLDEIFEFQLLTNEEDYD